MRNRRSKNKNLFLNRLHCAIFSRTKSIKFRVVCCACTTISHENQHGRKFTQMFFLASASCCARRKFIRRFFFICHLLHSFHFILVFIDSRCWFLHVSLVSSFSFLLRMKFLHGNRSKSNNTMRAYASTATNEIYMQIFSFSLYTLCSIFRFRMAAIGPTLCLSQPVFV